MSLQLLLVPLAPALVLGLLLFTTWIERRTLSPEALILRAVRTRSEPEVAERLVAVESARLLDDRRR